MKLKIVSLALVGVGLVGYFFSESSGVSAEQKAACEAALEKRGGPAAAIDELKKKCDDVGMVAMMQAQDKKESAQEAAKRISQANQGELASNGLQMAFLGLLIVGVLGLLMAFFKKK